MAPQSSKHRKPYNEPYTFDAPYINLPPKSHSRPGFEYVGTDEPRASASLSPNYQPSRRQSRTTSPPRHPRHERTYSPPPRPSHKSSQPHSKDKDRKPFRDSLKPPNLKNRYHDFAEQNPKLERYGKQGLNWLGKAAAAYVAANEGKEAMEPRPSRSPDRSRHRRHSLSPSPSPHRRPHSALPGERGHHRRHHERRYSASPPPLSRNPDSYHHASDRERTRRPHHRYHSPSPSPSPSYRPSHRGRPRSPSRTNRHRNSTAPPTSKTTERWQAAARAALEAGGITAFRLRKEPGSWTGDKAAKIATAALGAAAMDAFMDQDPRGAKGGMKGVAEGAISSLLASQIVGKAATRRGR